MRLRTTVKLTKSFSISTRSSIWGATTPGPELRKKCEGSRSRRRDLFGEVCFRSFLHLYIAPALRLRRRREGSARMDAKRTDGPLDAAGTILPAPPGILPINTWLPKFGISRPPLLTVCRYQFADFRGDLLAGLTVAAVLIPQGMSYSVLAGLPPIYGLFAGLMPMFSYSFFGTALRGCCFRSLLIEALPANCL